MELIMTPTGEVRCVYDETIDLHSLGTLVIQRASHVEPAADGRWQADHSPVAGPLLGPLANRSQALDAERAWLAANWLIPQS